jgi:hypothetical protein
MAAVLSAAAWLCTEPAAARCVSSGAIYSCDLAGGPTIMLSCFGAQTGGVQTCIDFSGRSLVVGQHWQDRLSETPATSPAPGPTDAEESTVPQTASADVQITPLPDVTFEDQLSAALAASAPRAQSAGAAAPGKQQQRPIR